jgi:hypothetical protein
MNLSSVTKIGVCCAIRLESTLLLNVLILVVRQVISRTLHKKLLRTRVQSLLKMLQVNTLLHTIQLMPDECDMHIYTKAILPRLKNTPQFRSVSQTRGVLRSNLLGRALYSVNDNPTLLWMFLSSNIPAAFAGRMP